MNEKMNDMTKEVPRSFYCPLTLDIMLDPVLDSQGNTYERVAIEAWLQLHQLSPLTKQFMDIRCLIPNKAMQEVIHGTMGNEWAEKRRQELPQGSVADFVANTLPQRTIKHKCSYRQIIDSYLQEISSVIGMELLLGANGVCAFTYKALEFQIQVEEFCSYYSISSLPLVPVITTEIKDKILRLNHFQTKGATLSMKKTKEGEGLQLMYIKGIAEVSSDKFRLILEDFIGTAASLRGFLLQQPTTAKKKLKQVIPEPPIQ